MSGVFVLDMETGRITKLVNESPQTPYAADWYGTGTGSPRWSLKSFSGVQIAPDNQSIIFCARHQQRADKFAANGWQPLQGSFALYAMPIPSGGDADTEDGKFINLYLPPDQDKAGKSAGNKGTMLPNTATTWPAQVGW